MFFNQAQDASHGMWRHIGWQNSYLYGRKTQGTNRGVSSKSSKPHKDQGFFKYLNSLNLERASTQMKLDLTLKSSKSMSGDLWVLGVFGQLDQLTVNTNYLAPLVGNRSSMAGQKGKKT